MLSLDSLGVCDIVVDIAETVNDLGQRNKMQYRLYITLACEHIGRSLALISFVLSLS